MAQNYLKKEKFPVKRETPLEFLCRISTIEEHYQQIFISAEMLHWNSSGSENTAFKSVVWRRFWTWALAISSLFSSDVDKFKLETLVKTLKNIADKKQVEIKETIKIISLNASPKLLVSEMLRLVNLILLVPFTNAVSEKSCSTLCRVKTYLRSSMTQKNLQFLFSYCYL